MVVSSSRYAILSTGVALNSLLRSARALRRHPVSREYHHLINEQAVNGICIGVAHSMNLVFSVCQPRETS